MHITTIGYCNRNKDEFSSKSIPLRVRPDDGRGSVVISLGVYFMKISNSFDEITPCEKIAVLLHEVDTIVLHFVKSIITRNGCIYGPI